MSYMLVAGAAVVAIAVWIAALYLEFGAAQSKKSKNQAAQRVKFTRAAPAEDSAGLRKGRHKSREFGQR